MAIPYFVNFRQFAWILFLALILFQPGCSGCRKKTLEVPPTEPANTTVEAVTSEPMKPANLEPSKPEPSQPEPSKPEPSQPEPSNKSEPSKPEPPKPEPSKPEEKVEVSKSKPMNAPKPQPVKVEPKKIDSFNLAEQKKAEEKAGETVNTVSPVNTKSPVQTKSPVNTESPVQQVEPIKKPQASGLMWLNRILRLGFIVILAEEKGTSQPEPPITEPTTPEPTTNEIKPEDLKNKPEPSTPEPSTPEPSTPEPERLTKSPQSPLLLNEKHSEKTEETDGVGKTVKTLRFNFKYAPWKDVIEWFADQAGLSLQADNVPQGSLNLTDNRYYTPTEALDVLNSYLLFKEYTILRKGNSMFVIYLPDGIPPNLLEPITPEELDERGKYEICRCVFSLNRTTPDIIQAEAEKLLGPQGSLVALPKSQQIVITETAGTLRTIRDIIKRIDDPDALSSGLIHVVEMQNLSADEALGIMRKLLAIEESDSSLRTAVDISGTKIWMSGRGDMIERAKEIIKTIDSSFASKDILLEGQPQFEVYDVGIANPTEVLAVLQTLLAGTPDVRLSLDTKTGGIAALGRPANHATIRETIRQMQLNVPKIEVISLNRLSPASAVDSIKKFFATSTVSDSSASAAKTTPGVSAPTVEADISARRIIVRGTVSQIAEIRALLLKLGEDGTGGKIANTSTIRNIPLSPAATALVLDQLKEIWPKLEQSEIKIVTPSAIVPMRSTHELKNDLKNDLKPKDEKKDEKLMDELIDETFDKEPPITQFRNNPRYLSVQQTKITETESPHQPTYQPIRTSEVSETEELKRQINELQKKLETIQLSSQPQTTNPKPQSLPPVVVSSGPNGLMISSEDPEALNKLEELIRMLSDESVLGKTSLAVYYLKNSTAEVVAQTLQTLMNSGNSSTFGVSGAGSVDTSPSFEGEQRAEVLGLLTFGNSIEKTGPVSISADARLNALLVQANPVDHKTIERLLPILDQADAQGGDILNRPKPRLIPLKNMRAEEAQTVVEKVYANRLQSGTGNTAASATSSSNRGTTRRSSGGEQMAMPMMPPMMPGMMPGGMSGGPGAMIQQLMGRMGGSTSGGSSTVKEPEPTMTLGVDSRSNSLIVSAPESLFLQVEAFVKELDAMAVQTETVVEVVPFKINSDLARQVISNVYGDSVKFSTSRSSTSSTTNSGFGGFGGSNNRFGNSSTGRFGGTGNNNIFGGGTNPFLNIMRGGNFGGAGLGGGGFGNNNPGSGFGTRPGGSGR